jgi:rhamnogalacturonan endolyase
VKPGIVMGRGYYTRLVRVAWDWRDGQLTQRWIFDSNVAGNGSHSSQGNHQLITADVDGDGKDDICSGSSMIRSDGTSMYANGLGHGDAIHLTDMDPSRAGLELWQCHEEPAQYGAYGLEFRDAKTGIPLWGVPATVDVGRALAADVDPRYKGYEAWGSVGGMYTCKGVQISTSHPTYNHAVWWDGDLLRELLDGTKLEKWDYTNNSMVRLLTLYLANLGSAAENNGTKANPALTADILGDWREEILMRSSDNNSLLLYTTVNPTVHKLYTLMHDPQYRLAIAWQNTAYNQPPHPGFYLGDSMAAAPVPNITMIGNQVTAIRPLSTPQEEWLQVLPTVSTHSFVIKVAGAFTYEVYSADGRKVEQGKANGETAAGGSLTFGNYYIQVHSRGRTTVRPVIKK